MHGVLLQAFRAVGLGKEVKEATPLCTDMLKPYTALGPKP